MEREHEAKYVEVCQANGWSIQLAKRMAREAGSTQTTLKTHLVPEAINRLKFSATSFHRALINFIVADDQLCFVLPSLKP